MAESADRALLQILELRAGAFSAIRRFFGEREFIEVDTPSVVPSPGLDPHLAAFEVRAPKGKSVGWLATSPEYQMKRLLSAGAKRIFQLSRSYRADEQGQHHEREFTMLEWYRADAGSEDVIRDTEALVAFVAESLDQPAPEVQPPWERMTVEDALQFHANVTLESLVDDEESFFRIWVEQVQPRLGGEQPVVVTDWPASMASLARIKDNGMADRFEAFYRGVELCNGFGELTDPDEQRRRFERDQEQRRALGVAVYPIDERFLDALKSGIPESGGNALGVERLLMLLLGADSIQAVMPFPEERL
ncbi:MAG TPA: EF-P lysine aminoacylase EpmA [Polyangiales bacterium]|nr:EF-P lysine aminoacylase EpmA [Polyangiales bacterium]